MPVSRTLAIGIGEVRHSPTLLPCFWGTAGMIADCLPHQWAPRWHMTPHFGIAPFAEKPWCTAARKHPAIIQLLDGLCHVPQSTQHLLEAKLQVGATPGACTATRGVSSSDVEALPRQQGAWPGERDDASATASGDESRGAKPGKCARSAEALQAPEPVDGTALLSNHGATLDAEQGTEDQPQVSCSDAVPRVLHGAAIGAGLHPRSPFAAAELAAQSYYARNRQLEQTCKALLCENQRILADIQAASAQRRHTQELNRRLLQEVRQAREERGSAAAQAEQLAAELGRLRYERLAEAAAAATAAPSFSRQLRDGGRRRTAATALPPSTEADPELPPGLAVDTGCSPRTCATASAWGCIHHQLYSRALFLAHRALHIQISRGAPGLELEVEAAALAPAGASGGLRMESAAKLAVRY